MSESIEITDAEVEAFDKNPYMYDRQEPAVKLGEKVGVCPKCPSCGKTVLIRHDDGKYCCSCGEQEGVMGHDYALGRSHVPDPLHEGLSYKQYLKKKAKHDKAEADREKRIADDNRRIFGKHSACGSSK